MFEADLGARSAFGVHELPLASSQDWDSIRKARIQIERSVPQTTLGEYLIVVLAEKHRTETLHMGIVERVQQHTVGLSAAGAPP